MFESFNQPDIILNSGSIFNVLASSTHTLLNQTTQALKRHWSFTALYSYFRTQGLCEAYYRYLINLTPKAMLATDGVMRLSFKQGEWAECLLFGSQLSMEHF